MLAKLARIPPHSPRAAIAISVGLFLLGLFGLRFISFKVNPLDLLPKNNNVAQGIIKYHHIFAKDDELIIFIEKLKANVDLKKIGGELVASLKEKDLIQGEKNELDEKSLGKAFAAGVAYAWLNSQPQACANLIANLQNPNKVEAEINDSLAEISTNTDFIKIALHGYDPLRLRRLPSLEKFITKFIELGENLRLQSESFHILKITMPPNVKGYRACNTWLSNVKKHAQDFLNTKPENALKLSYTGEPVFVSEIGMGMERDMWHMLSLTIIFISFIFWLIQREIASLLLLIAAILLIYLLTLSLAGAFFGKLDMMSIGFAAILVALAADYGIIVAREAVTRGGNGKELRQKTAKSIIWAALSSAMVFFTFSLSGFPALNQLGSLVGIGLLVGAIIILVIYAPLVGKKAKFPMQNQQKNIPTKTSKLALFISGILVVFTIGVLIFKQLPTINYNFQPMLLKNSQAVKTLDKIESAMEEATSSNSILIVEAENDEELRAKATTFKKLLAAEKSRGKLNEFTLLDEFIPNTANQKQNRKTLLQIIKNENALIDAIEQAGFNQEAHALLRAVFANWREIIQKPEATNKAFFPNSSADSPNAALLEKIYLGKKNSKILIGEAEIADYQKVKENNFRALSKLNGDGYHLTNFNMFSLVVYPLLKADVKRLFLPMLVVMLILLFLAFGKLSDVILCVTNMCLSLALLTALISLSGATWNFMNLAALPLIIGCGLDYGIHTILALERDHSLSAYWHNTGKALVFCGLSSACGFGALALSSNQGLASIGSVGGTGILISMINSVYFLPHWRNFLRAKSS